PPASSDEAVQEHGISLIPIASLRPADAVVFAVAHKEDVAGGWPLIAKLLKDGEGIVLDIKAQLDRDKKPSGIDLWRPYPSNTAAMPMADGPILVTGAA